MRVFGMKRGTAVLLCALVGTVYPAIVRAEPAAAALEGARQAFKDGVQLEKDGKYEEALAKFEDVAKVKVTPQVRFHIAMCNEKLGYYGAAIEAYEAAAKQATDEGIAPEVSSAAPGLAKTLREKRPKVTVTYANNVTPDTLTIDGVDVDPKEAKDYAVDPGRHVIIATSGDRTAREEIKVRDSETANVRIALGAPPAKPSPVYEDPAENVSTKPVDTSPKVSSATRTAGWVFGGLGLASLGVAGAFFVMRNNTLEELDNACANRTCPTSTRETYDKAKTFNTVSAVALGVGAGAVVLGATLIIFGKPSEPAAPPPVARVVPWAPGSTVGIGLEGAF